MEISATRGLPVDATRAEAPIDDDWWIIAAIAVIAFVLADVGHEVLGHGIGFVIACGRSGVLTTTRLIAHQRLADGRWHIFDLGGPLSNLFFAGVAWLWQRLLRRPAGRLRLLLWLVMAFSLFWAFGYLIYCAVVGRGDWLALVPDTAPEWIWRSLLFAAGILLYRRSMLLTASELHWIVPARDAQWPSRVRRIAFLSYLAGGLIACAGAILDPRGAMEVLNSGAASSLLASLGMLRMPRLFGRMADKPMTPAPTIHRNVLWILAATVISIFYIAVLGLGIKFALR